MEFLESFTGLSLPWWGWMVVLLSGAGVAIAKAALPGSGILVTALMVMALPARMGVAAMLPMMLLGSVASVKKYHRFIDRRQLTMLVTSALLGLAVGYFVLRRASNEQLKPVIGTMILLMLTFQQGNDYLRRRRSAESAGEERSVPPALTVLFGTLAGMGTGMANAGSPIISLYLLMANLPKLPFLGTSTAFFFVMDFLKIPMYLNLGMMTEQVLKVGLLTLPSLIPGMWLAFWMAGRIPQKTFVRLIQVLTAVAALKLLM